MKKIMITSKSIHLRQGYGGQAKLIVVALCVLSGLSASSLLGDNNVNVTRMPFGTLTDRSGTIAAANVQQQIVAANTGRRYFIFQNVSDTDMWINFGAAATAGKGSFLIKASGGSMTFEASAITTQAVTVFCTSSGKGFTAKEL